MFGGKALIVSTCLVISSFSCQYKLPSRSVCLHLCLNSLLRSSRNWTNDPSLSTTSAQSIKSSKVFGSVLMLALALRAMSPPMVSCGSPMIGKSRPCKLNAFLSSPSVTPACTRMRRWRVSISWMRLSFSVEIKMPELMQEPVLL